MANIGDLVTTLVMDTTKYDAAPAIGQNNVLGGSIDSIIGKLLRQKKALENTHATTRGNILNSAATGASEGQVNAALGLQDEVERLQAKAAAIRKKADETAAAAAADARAKQAGESYINSLRDEINTLNMTSSELRGYKAAQVGVTQEVIKSGRQLEWQIGTQQRFERSIQKQIEAQQAANAGSRRGTMMVTEGIRGVEDAVAGFTTNGLKGMLMGVTNNVTQLGSLMGGNAGLMLSIGGIAALIAVSLVPKLIDWANNTKAIEEASKALAESTKRQHDEEVKRLNERLDLNAELARIARDNARQIEDAKPVTGVPLSSKAENLKRAVRDKKDEAESQSDIQNRERMKQMDLRQANPGLGHVGGLPQWVRDGRKSMTEEARKAAEAADIKANEDWNKSLATSKAANQKQLAAQQQAGRLELSLQAQLADDKRKQKQQEREEQESRDEADNQKEMKLSQDKYKLEKQLRKDNAATTMDLIRKKSPLAAELLEKQIADEEQRKLVTRGLANGAINQAEANKLNSQIGKRDVVPLGGSAAATQSGTTAAYSSIVRAMQVKREDTFAKQQLEKTQDLVDIQRKLLDKDPIKVNTLAM